MDDFKGLLPPNDLPQEVLEFFHRITKWVEEHKSRTSKSTLSWKKVIRKTTLLRCVKPKAKTKLTIPPCMDVNVLYIQSVKYSGYDVIKQLRNSYCHAAISYDKNKKLIEIKHSDDVKIAGKFSIEAIQELVKVILDVKK